MSSTSRRPLAAALALAVVGLAPAAAQADSMVFVKDGEVWISQIDGSHARALTAAANGWAWPSIADDGTVVVAGGQTRINPGGTDSDGSSELYRLDQRGRQLGDPIPTFGSYSSPACPTYPPSPVRVSPDGRTIAYSIFNCGAIDLATYFTPSTATGLSFPNQPGGGQLDYVNPVWLDDGQLLVSHNGPTISDTQSVYGTISIADDSTAGGPVSVGDSDVLSSYQATIDRAGDRLAFLEDDHPDQLDGKPRTARLLLYSTNGSALAPPTLRCTLTLDASRFSVPFRASPSFSPDGKILAFAMDDGVHEVALDDLASCSGVVDRLVVPGGAEPFQGRGGQALLPNVAPRAAFSFAPRAPRAGQAVSLNAAASGDPDGRLVAYAWSFGDHGSAASARPRATHVFRRPGRYRVRLTVRDDRGARRSATHVVTVR